MVRLPALKKRLSGVFRQSQQLIAADRTAWLDCPEFSGRSCVVPISEVFCKRRAAAELGRWAVMTDRRKHTTVESIHCVRFEQS